MVVEHMTDPEGAVAALARLSRPGCHVIVYTVNKWSPVSLLAALTPTSIHYRFKKILWGGEDRDTFPTVYRMNTRNTLKHLFASFGFHEQSFERLSDTRVSARSKFLSTIELFVWRGLKAIGLIYPENCLLGVYSRR